MHSRNGFSTFQYVKKDPDIVPEEYPLIVLDSKSAMCIDKNDNDTKHTRHIVRIINVKRN